MINDKAVVVFGQASKHLLKDFIWKFSEYPYEILHPVYKQFDDGEQWVKFPESIRNRDVFIIQSTNQPDSNLMELLIMIDAAKRASAKSITAIIPYFGYARQDRKDQSRVPITARLVAKMIETAGGTRVVTIDLHAPQIQGFFDIPVDNLKGAYTLYKHMTVPDNSIVFAPDLGREKDAATLAAKFNISSGLLSKMREEDSLKHHHIYGTVQDQHVFLYDDIIASGNTLLSAALLLKNMKAKTITILATHACFTNWSNFFNKCYTSLGIDKETLLITNTINQGYIPSVNYTVCDVSPLIHLSICNILEGRSISTLF